MVSAPPVGDALPALPLFLWADRYINVDLEQTYRSAWEVYSGPLKAKVESGTQARGSWDSHTDWARNVPAARDFCER
jgi:hypothetical protein